MLSSNAKSVEPGNPPRRTSNRHRKQGKVGKFASAAAQYDLTKRGDGKCVAGRWISENLDEDDVAELTRLANGHRWKTILRLSDNQLKENSLTQHVHGICPCFDGVVARGCCTSCDKADS